MNANGATIERVEVGADDRFACGHQVTRSTPVVDEVYSPGLAAVLSFLIPGLGQAYNGEVGKAVLFFLGWILVIPWALAVMDAYYSARIKNLENRAR